MTSVDKADINWFIWTPILFTPPLATLIEMQTVYSLTDLFEMNLAIQEYNHHMEKQRAS